MKTNKTGSMPVRPAALSSAGRFGRLLVWTILLGIGLEFIMGAAGLRRVFAAEETFEIELEAGYDGFYIPSRISPFRVTVTGREDFSGTVELLYREQNDILAYKQDLVLAAGETKEILFLIKPPLEEASMTIRLVNEDGKTKEAISTDLPGNNVSGFLAMGMLSGNDTKTYPYTALNGYLVPLTPEDITTEEGSLGMLDIILVDQFDLDGLGSARLAALENWVKDGGTLVLGTGSYYSQTLLAFSDSFLSGRVGDVEQWEYTDEEGASALMSYCPLELSDASAVLTLSDRPVLYQIPREKGSVLVSAISLQVPSGVYMELGGVLYGTLEKLASEKSLRRVEEEASGGYVYYVDNALNQGNDENIPKTSMYALVLFLYVVLVGPVVYLILKKLDKRHYMWVVVPCCSLLFTGVIYLLGMSTRIQEPYMNYVSYLDYGEQNPAEKTFFSLTAPYNRSYNVVVEKDYKISPIRLYGYIYYQSGEVFEDYKEAIYEHDGGTEIELNKPAAFESFDFVAEGNAAASGTYETELTVDEEGNLVGSFTNLLGYDLEYVFLAYQGIVTYIGNVAGGETVAVNSGLGDGVLLDSYYSIGNNPLLNDVFDDFYRDSDKARKYYALGYYLSNYGYQRREDTYFIGIAAGTGERSDVSGEENFVSKSEMKYYGATVTILPVDNVEQNGFVNTIDEHIDTVLEGNYELPWSRYMNTETVVLDYLFPDQDTTPVQAIMYTARFNNELKGYGSDYFLGNIYFLNQETGDYDLIFTGGVEGACKDLTPYLNDGHLTIRYEADPDEFSNGSISLPILSAVQEVRTNGAD